MPRNQPINASITVSVTRRADPQNKTITFRISVMKALIIIVIAITTQSHPTNRKRQRTSLCIGALRFDTLTARKSFG